MRGNAKDQAWCIEWFGELLNVKNADCLNARVMMEWTQTKLGPGNTLTNFIVICIGSEKSWSYLRALMDLKIKLVFSLRLIKTVRFKRKYTVAWTCADFSDGARGTFEKYLLFNFAASQRPTSGRGTYLFHGDRRFANLCLTASLKITKTRKLH